MKKFFTLTALAIAISASAATKDKWPTSTIKSPTSICSFAKFQAKQKFLSWPESAVTSWPTESVLSWSGI